MSVIEQIKGIFYPKSIAVIGASDDPKKMSYLTTAAFLDMGFEGEIYPVNKGEARTVYDRKVYNNIKDVPDPVDLAVLSVPPQAVPGIVKECAEKGVKGIIIFSAPGHSRTKEEEEAIELAVSSGSRIIGPNSMGLYCPYSGLALFPEMSKEKGHVSFISHSGAMAWSFSFYAANRKIACNKVITAGNEWDLTWLDYLEYLETDPKTEIITGYLEGVKDGKRFLEVAKRITPEKPIIIIKGGYSEVGSKGALSHTGSISGERETWSGVLDQAGVIIVKDLNELMEHVILFHFLKNHPMGKRVGIVSGTGGPTILASDLCYELGMEVPELSSSTKEKVREFLPLYGTSDRNPIDISIASATNPDLYIQGIKTLDECDDVDIILCVHTGEWRGEELAEYIVEKAAGKIKKPLVVSLIGTPEKCSRPILKLIEAGIPSLNSIDGAVHALAALNKWTVRKNS